MPAALKTAMPKGRVAQDYTGHRFGRLVVLERAPNTKRGVCWLCRCDCGNEKVIPAQDLRSKTKSCGCYAKDYQRERLKREGWAMNAGRGNGCADHLITYRGRTQRLYEWCKELAPEYETTERLLFAACSNRYTRGWRGEELLKPTTFYYNKKYTMPDPQFDIHKDVEQQMKAK